MMSAAPKIRMPPAPAARRATDRVQVFNDAMDSGWSPRPDMDADELRAMREEIRAARENSPTPAPSRAVAKPPRR